MDTDQTIIKFFQDAVINDFARDILFRVESIAFDGGVVLTPEDMIYARTASVPAREIVNQEAKAYGQTFNVPGTVTYPDSAGYEIEFYCPENSSLREVLMNESFRTFGSVLGIAGSGQGGGSIASANSRIVLLQLDKNLNTTMKYELIGASIRKVGDIAYNMADGNGAILTFKVSVAYHFFNREAVGDDIVEPLNA
jgi:hypothetical protein